MKRRYIAIAAGIIFAFALMTGCGSRPATQNGQTDGGGTQREEELQAEIDALRQEIDELKSGQQEAGDTPGGSAAEGSQGADNGQTSDGAQTSSGGENTAGGSGEMLSIEEALDIALERVPGATDKNISIELDRDDGWYIYEGDIHYDGMEYEFEIDANTGSILKWEEERW